MDFRPHLSHTLSPTSLITVNGGPEATQEGEGLFWLTVEVEGDTAHRGGQGGLVAAVAGG